MVAYANVQTEGVEYTVAELVWKIKRYLLGQTCWAGSNMETHEGVVAEILK